MLSSRQVQDSLSELARSSQVGLPGTCLGPQGGGGREGVVKTVVV